MCNWYKGCSSEASDIRVSGIDARDPGTEAREPGTEAREPGYDDRVPVSLFVTIIRSTGTSTMRSLYTIFSCVCVCVCV